MTMEPTPEQIARWLDPSKELVTIEDVARLAYAAGADAELEACCDWIAGNLPKGGEGEHLPEVRLRAARRPKPPSLKRQALEALNTILVTGDPALLDPIYEALESLPND